ncbi:MAG TPA: FG-GAP-like repeat-containing protein [Bacteroidales bacterium]|nr:FG-GAP-like repeat-containing protein [Bacteroidales bacterium]
MKTAHCVFIIALSVIINANTYAQSPSITWWFDTHDASFGQTAAGDIDHDGKLELVFGCYRNDSSVYALNAEDGSLLWKNNTHAVNAEGCNDVAPVIYDIDNDDTLDVIVPASCNPATFCFNGPDGKIKWQTPTRGSDSPPTIADIDNDGKAEILHGEFDGYVICINAENGSVAWEIPVNNNSWIQTAPTILDLDADGQLDFVVASWAFSGDTNYVYAYRANNQALLWKHALDDVVYHGTAVADLDNDTRPELVIGDYSGKLSVLNGENGSTCWNYTFPQGYSVGAPASIADLDNDGNCEVICSGWYKMTALRHDGSSFWNYSIPGYASAFRGAALADIDNDNKPDVVFGTSDGDVIALKGTTGLPLWIKDLAAHYGDTLDFDHAPIIADFDNDDTLDLFIVGGDCKYPDFQNNYGRGYALSIGTGAGPDWLMFQHDIRRQSSLCYNPNNAIKEPNSSDTKSLTVFPNPANSSLNVQFSNPQKQEHILKIYNATGQVVQQVENIKDKQVTVELITLQKGIYFFTIQNNNGIAGQGKFILE